MRAFKLRLRREEVSVYRLSPSRHLATQSKTESGDKHLTRRIVSSASTMWVLLRDELSMKRFFAVAAFMVADFAGLAGSLRVVGCRSSIERSACATPGGDGTASRRCAEKTVTSVG
jgi:hypothetical protein